VEVSVKDWKKWLSARKNSAKHYGIHDGGRQVDKSSCGRKTGNLAAGDGHPAEIMDMSFALQA